MKYLLDTANLDAIRYYTDIFPIAGVTSNPSIVKKEGKIDFFAHMKKGTPTFVGTPLFFLCQLV